MSSDIDLINNTLAVHNRDDRTKMEIIKTYLRDGENKNTIASAIEQMGKAAKLLNSEESGDVFAGILVILSGFALLIPVEGPVVSAILYVAASLISAFCESKINIGDVVENSIHSSLKKFEDSELKAKAYGTVTAYRISLAFLDRMTNVRREEVPTLMTSVSIFSGVEFLGILKYKIGHHSKIPDMNEALRAIEYTKSYVELAILRNSVVFKLYSIVKQCDHSKNIADGIYNVLKEEQATDKHFLKFLIKPHYSRALFFASLYPSTMPKVLGYLNHLGLKVQLLKLSNDPYHLTADRNCFGMKRSNSDAMMKYNAREKSSEYVELAFSFEAISDVDSLFYIRSKKKPYLYMYMSNKSGGQCYACSNKPGLQGCWKILQFEDGKYMLSTQKWPNWFLKGTDDIPFVLSTRGAPYYNVIIELSGQKNESTHFTLKREVS